MTDSSRDPLLSDPLTEVTRKERLYLLGASSVGLVLVYSGLVPTEISTLGVKFAETDQRALLHMLALVIGYFLMAFIIYGVSDFLGWWRAFTDQAAQREREALKRERTELIESIQSEMEQEVPDTFSYSPEDEMMESLDEKRARSELRLNRKYQRQAFAVRPVSVLRAIFEFALPIVVGIYTILILVF